MACEKIPSQSFKIQQVAKFVKLDLLTSHTDIVALKYANAHFEDPTCGIVFRLD